MLPTTQTGRCRRHYQNQCKGKATKGLCTKHRDEWNARKDDWTQRATTSNNTPPTPPARAAAVHHLGGPDSGDYRFDIDPGWYSDQPCCDTSDGPHPTQAEAQQAATRHNRQPCDVVADPVRVYSPIQGGTHCVSGHEYTPKNTLYREGKGRICRTCRNIRAANYRARNANRKAAA